MTTWAVSSFEYCAKVPLQATNHSSDARAFSVCNRANKYNPVFEQVLICVADLICLSTIQYAHPKQEPKCRCCRAAWTLGLNTVEGSEGSTLAAPSIHCNKQFDAVNEQVVAAAAAVASWHRYSGMEST